MLGIISSYSWIANTNTFVLLTDTSIFLLRVPAKFQSNKIFLHWRVTIITREIRIWVRCKAATLDAIRFLYLLFTSNIDTLTFSSNINYSPSDLYCRRLCNKKIRSILLRSKQWCPPVESNQRVNLEVTSFFGFQIEFGLQFL